MYNECKLYMYLSCVGVGLGKHMHANNRLGILAVQ